MNINENVTLAEVIDTPRFSGRRAREDFRELARLRRVAISHLGLPEVIPPSPF